MESDSSPVPRRSLFCASPIGESAGNFIHDVSDLGESIHFYRDLIGMEVPRPPGDWQTTEGVLKMYGASGGKFRVANAQVTGIAMRLDMVEFQGVDRKAVRRAPGQPGASLLILTVAELQPASIASATPIGSRGETSRGLRRPWDRRRRSGWLHCPRGATQVRCWTVACGFQECHGAAVRPHGE